MSGETKVFPPKVTVKYGKKSFSGNYAKLYKLEEALEEHFLDAKNQYLSKSKCVPVLFHGKRNICNIESWIQLVTKEVPFELEYKPYQLISANVFAEDPFKYNIICINYHSKTLQFKPVFRAETPKILVWASSSGARFRVDKDKGIVQLDTDHGFQNIGQLSVFEETDERKIVEVINSFSGHVILKGVYKNFNVLRVAVLYILGVADFNVFESSTSTKPMTGEEYDEMYSRKAQGNPKTADKPLQVFVAFKS